MTDNTERRRTLKDHLDHGGTFLGTFRRLSIAELERLIAKGRQDAKELDENIRSSFEMTAEDADLRLDAAK